MLCGFFSVHNWHINVHEDELEVVPTASLLRIPLIKFNALFSVLSALDHYSICQPKDHLDWNYIIEVVFDNKDRRYATA